MKKLGFGAMRLPVIDPNDKKSIDYPQLCRMIDTFLDRDGVMESAQKTIAAGDECTDGYCPLIS